MPGTTNPSLPTRLKPTIRFADIVQKGERAEPGHGGTVQLTSRQPHQSRRYDRDV
jgi:hypothetical protein